jgi:hypothetical protein
VTDAMTIAMRWRDLPTAEDALEINNLMQAYALCTDLGRIDELASMFTDDAFWDGHELGYGTATGPVDIANIVAGHFNPDKPMMHSPGPGLLTRTADGVVEAFSWCLAARFADGHTSPVIYFSYEDELRRTPDRGWLFSRRYLRLRFREK